MGEFTHGGRKTAGPGVRPAAAQAVTGTTTAHEGILRRQSARESAARTCAPALPIVPVRARGMTIEGADGRRYLDCLSGAGALALGHNHPVVLEAIRKVIDSGAPLHVSDLATPVRDGFITELFRTLPPGLADRARVRFCGPAGTDAVATALQLVRAATGRAGVLAFTGAHHALAAGSPDAARSASSGAQITLLPYPQDYRCPFGIGGERGAELAARWTESVLDSPASGVPLPAGMIVEPVQGDGGVLPAPDAWLRRIRRLTADRSVPLIADETLTGVGRTGAFWAVEHSGVTPDAMVLSAAIGGSLPLTVVVHRDDLDNGASGTHTGTFPGNQLAMAAGTATLGHVRENGLAEHAATLGARMLDRLRTLAGELACVGEVRGRGLMIGVELVDPEGGDDEGHGITGPGPTVTPDGTRGCRPRPAAPELAVAVQRECLRRGLIVDLGGPCASVVRLFPPLTTTDGQAGAVLDRLADALQAAARAPFAHRRAEQPRHPPREPHHPAGRTERTG